MKLQEKILYCRKKRGLSQEALAEQLGVSRQAISKWETGDAVPEINKLLLLSNAFNVTTDWLLSEEEPQKDEKADPITASVQQAPNTSWVDSAPGIIGRLLRRFGWLIGLYLAVVGFIFTGIGVLARYMVHQMFNNNIFSSMDTVISGEPVYFNTMGTQINNTLSNFSTNNPVYIMGTVIMVVGIIIMIVGILLAIILKKNRKN